VCGQRYALKKEAAACCVGHGVYWSAALLESEQHVLSDGTPGVWLAAGDTCPSCGSTSGGWVCAGKFCNLQPCFPPFSVKNATLNVTADAKCFCVHGGDAKHGELRQVLKHLRAHADMTEATLNEMKAVGKHAECLGCISSQDALLSLDPPPAPMAPRILALRSLHAQGNYDQLQRCFAASGSLSALQKASDHLILKALRSVSAEDLSDVVVTTGSAYMLPDPSAMAGGQLRKAQGLPDLCLLVTTLWTGQEGHSYVASIPLQRCVSCREHHASRV